MGESIQTVYTYRQGENYAFKPLRVSLLFWCKNESDKEIFIIFDQACDRVLPLNDSTHFIPSS